MPKIVERLKNQLRSKGIDNAWAVAVSQLQKHGILKKGSKTNLTSKGTKRNSMTPAQRAKDRAAKYSKGKHTTKEYNYNPKTNRSKLKK